MIADKRIGKQTVRMQNPPVIKAYAAIVSAKEGDGPLGKHFDQIVEDEYWGEKSFEKAESKFVRETLSLILKKGNLSIEAVNYIIAGDLLDQCIASSFGIRETDTSFFGIYGACSTIAESISLASMLADGGYADNIICITSSHFCSAEKQFRFPLEFGNQRPPTAQWTVTGSGGVLVSREGEGPKVTYITTGKIIDAGMKNSNNMGAAMAPAAADTISIHLQERQIPESYYDLIVTGDLGEHGKELCIELLQEKGYNIQKNYDDCGTMIYDLKKQKVGCGGSGCGCSASVLASYLLPQMKDGKINKLLFIATGALLSPTSVYQGETIPAIAHAVSVENV